MAQRTITILTSDLSGEELERGKGQTVEFALDGRSYLIDLTDKEAEKLRDSLSKFVAVARRSGGSGRSRSTAPKRDTRAVREWANANGFEVGDRGRVPSEAQQAYDAAH